MNTYTLLKLNRLISNPYIKGLGIWLLHVLNKRYLVVYLDPVLACNLRCRMCYFSNEEKRNEMNGSIKADDLERISESIFKQALKLQIGCGAEPSLYKHNSDIVKLGKACNVPYISYTTNANLLTNNEIDSLLEAGLDEFTISLHGVYKETYEYLMQNASYEKFLTVINYLSEVKKRFPLYKLRVNYTVNEINLEELVDFFKAVSIDILQIRPITDIGGEIKSIQNKEAFNVKFNSITGSLKEQTKENGIILIAPVLEVLKKKKNRSSSIMDSIYCYISPRNFFQDDFDWRNETFREYSRRTSYASKLFWGIFKKKKLMDNFLNYDIN